MKDPREVRDRLLAECEHRRRCDAATEKMLAALRPLYSTDGLSIEGGPAVSRVNFEGRPVARVGAYVSSAGSEVFCVWGGGIRDYNYSLKEFLLFLADIVGREMAEWRPTPKVRL